MNSLPTTPRADSTHHNPRLGTGVGSAHAKAILIGEHAVVYGTGAIAFPVHGLDVHVELEPAEGDIHISSELFTGEAATAPARLTPVLTAIRTALAEVGTDSGVALRILSSVPPERGLGSSAAVAAAVARAAADASGLSFDDDQLQRVVQAAERAAHGKPSGLDARAVAAAGPILFQGGQATPLKLAQTLHVAIADSGMAGSTAQAVAEVRALREAQPKRVNGVIDAIGDLIRDSEMALAAGDLDRIGHTMQRGHELLSELGVSNPLLDALVATATDHGALGAKLTGGGKGGCVIALARSGDEADAIASAMRAGGAARSWTVAVPAA